MKTSDWNEAAWTAAWINLPPIATHARFYVAVCTQASARRWLRFHNS